MFRAEVFKFLKKEGKISDELINKLTRWRHSGFSVDNGVRISEKDEKGCESVAQYILRNPFSAGKITYIEKTGKVIYHSKMKKGENRKNFMTYSAEEFIAAITQHIPKKSFQMVRYYGWYSNKSRGLRLKNDLQKIGIKPENPNDIEIIDVSKYQPKKVPSLTWRECIKKIWADDPLICPECLSEMRIISFITEVNIIKKILKYLDLWDEKRGSQLRTHSARDPPVTPDIPNEILYVPIDDGWGQPSSDYVS